MSYWLENEMSTAGPLLPLTRLAWDNLTLSNTNHVNQIDYSFEQKDLDWKHHLRRHMYFCKDLKATIQYMEEYFTLTAQQMHQWYSFLDLDSWIKFQIDYSYELFHIEDGLQSRRNISALSTYIQKRFAWKQSDNELLEEILLRLRGYVLGTAEYMKMNMQCGDEQLSSMFKCIRGCQNSLIESKE